MKLQYFVGVLSQCDVDLIHNVALILILLHFAHIIMFKMLVNCLLQGHIKMLKILVNMGLQAHTKVNHC